MTWHPPEGLTIGKVRKAAGLAANAWEQEVKQSAGQADKTSVKAMAGYSFERFVNEVWIPLYLRDGSHRPSTIAYYNGLLKRTLLHFQGVPLDQITGVKINAFLSWLRTKQTHLGKPLADKFIKQHYDTLRLVFNYAERQEIITANPMKKADAPKVARKPVDALSKKEAAAFLSALETCSLDFRCMLHLLITTGLRRGKCLELQWRDFDFDNKTVHVERSVTNTVEAGTIVSAPKTAKSVRTIPLMDSTVALIKEWRRQMENQYAKKNLDCAFLFGSPTDTFSPRDPSSITRRMARFIKAAGLPDV
jgi:integrase